MINQPLCHTMLQRADRLQGWVLTLIPELLHVLMQASGLALLGTPSHTQCIGTLIEGITRSNVGI